jgi:hypothetical protein
MLDRTLRFSDCTVSRLPSVPLLEIRRVRGRPDATVNGTHPIDRPGNLTFVDGGRLLWLRPGVWLAVAADDQLAKRLWADDGRSWWCSDVTDALVTFQFTGADPLARLSHAGPVRDALRFGPGLNRTCARLLLAQVPVVVEGSPSADGTACTAWIESPLAEWWWRWWEALAASEGSP